MDVTSDEAFWGSLTGGAYMRRAEEGRLFAVLCVLWLHRNAVIFKGRLV